MTRNVTLPSGLVVKERKGYLWLPELCPARDEHTTFPDDPEPSGYIAWDSWAARIGKTHRQVRHSVCGLLTIWVPIKRRVASVPEPAE